MIIGLIPCMLKALEKNVYAENIIIAGNLSYDKTKEVPDFAKPAKKYQSIKHMKGANADRKNIYTNKRNIAYPER